MPELLHWLPTQAKPGDVLEERYDHWFSHLGLITGPMRRLSSDEIDQLVRHCENTDIGRWAHLLCCEGCVPQPFSSMAFAGLRRPTASIQPHALVVHPEVSLQTTAGLRSYRQRTTVGPNAARKSAKDCFGKKVVRKNEMLLKHVRLQLARLTFHSFVAYA